MSQKRSRKRKLADKDDLNNCSGASQSKKSHDDIDNVQNLLKAGTVKCMVLKNFMCHQLLEVNFTSNLSFFVGKNGSGKSAILTGLVVGLGGKAALTQRGTSLKSFVQVGAHSASVEIQLNNDGVDAYRPKVYGKVITVIRTLSATSGGGYQIKNERGEIVSNKALEVTNITNALNIQFNNPVCILNQDTSRNFLNSNSSRDWYTLFMKATQLDILNETYMLIRQNKEQCHEEIAQKENGLQKLKLECQELKAKIDQHKSIAQLKDRKVVLQKELFWARVTESEIDCQQHNKEFKNLQRELKYIQKRLEQRREQHAKFSETMNQLLGDKDKIKNAITEHGKNQKEIKVIGNQLKEQYQNKKRARMDILYNIESMTKERDFAHQQLQQYNEKILKMEKGKTDRLKRIEAIQDKLKVCDDFLKTYENDLLQLEWNLPSENNEGQRLRNDIRKLEYSIMEEQTNYDALINQSDNRLLLYGPQIVRVKELIAQRRNSFKHEPKGPFGHYVKVNEKKWLLAAEGILESVLRAFVVDNVNDNKLLYKIFKEVYGDDVTRYPAVITTPFVFKPYDISKNKVHVIPNSVCLYDVIQVEDVVILNAIIDSTELENILLIKEDEQAMRLMSIRENVPTNCNQTITINGNIYYPVPNYRIYSCPFRPPKYLKVDTKEVLEQMRKTINDLKRQKETLFENLNNIEKKAREQQSKANDLKERIQKLIGAKIKLNDELHQVKLQLEPEEISSNMREEEIREINLKLEQKQGALSKIDSEIKEIERQITENEFNSTEIERNIDNSNARLQQIEEQMRDCRLQQNQFEIDMTSIGKEKANIDKKMSDVVSELENTEKLYKDFLRQAEALGEKPEEVRKMTDINDELTEIKRLINKEENKVECITDVLNNYNNMRRKYNSGFQKIESLRKTLEELNQAVEKRKDNYNLYEIYCITLISHYFLKILEYRNFKGALNVNKKEKTLEIKVLPQHGSQAPTNVVNLSGGERSFCTVAFLFALWQCMDTPFYVLDEFDVFMDQLNRTKVVQILIRHAKCNPKCQFIFLTPQDISFVQDVDILRLEDPRN